MRELLPEVKTRILCRNPDEVQEQLGEEILDKWGGSNGIIYHSYDNDSPYFERRKKKRKMPKPKGQDTTRRNAVRAPVRVKHSPIDMDAPMPPLPGPVVYEDRALYEEKSFSPSCFGIGI